MRYLAGIWRLAIAALCFIGTSPAWHAVSLWAFLMYQIGFIAGIVMLWSGCASILRGVQPPALLRGFVLTYAFSLAAVHFFVTPAAEFGVPAQQVIPLSAQVLALIVVGMLAVDFFAFEPHRAFKPVYPLVWLVYLPLYAAFAIARAYWFPHSGPTANAYPYDYLIITQFTRGGAGVACLKIVAIYLAVGVVLCLFDRALPAKSAAE